METQPVNRATGLVAKKLHAIALIRQAWLYRDKHEIHLGLRETEVFSKALFFIVLTNVRRRWWTIVWRRGGIRTHGTLARTSVFKTGDTVVNTLFLIYILSLLVSMLVSPNFSDQPTHHLITGLTPLFFDDRTGDGVCNA